MPNRPIDNDENFNDVDFESLDLLEDDLSEEADLPSVGENNFSSSLSDDLDGVENGILLFKGRKYAVGLTWLTIEDDGEAGIVSKRANLFSADFFCNRVFVSQSGFGTLKQGHRMGMSAVAAMAADVLVGEWHGVFCAENGWYYVAVHADIIAPDGDQFFASEEDAYNNFILAAENYNWPKTYVPEAWNFKGNDGEIPLDRLMEDVATTSLRPANLDALFSGKANKNFVMVGVIIFVLFLCVSLFSESILSGIIPDRLSGKVQEVEVSDILIVPPKNSVSKPNPLLQAIENFYLPQPSKVVENCMMNFDDLIISLPGWKLSKMKCRNNFVEALWQKETGSLETIKNYIDQFPFGVSSTYGSRGDFLASRIVGNSSQYNQKISLAPREKILLMLNNRFGKIGKLDVRDIVPISQKNKRNVGGSRRLASKNNKEKDNKETITMQDLPSLAVKLNTKISPVLIKQYFNIPGLKFSALEWDVNNGIWLYDLQIYLSPQVSKVRTNIR